MCQLCVNFAVWIAVNSVVHFLRLFLPSYKDTNIVVITPLKLFCIYFLCIQHIFL